jgi:hypothetical protein
MRMPRIVMLEPYPAPAGGEEHAAELIRRDSLLAAALTELGHPVLAVKTTRGTDQVEVETSTGTTWEFHPVESDSEVPDGRCLSTSIVQAVCAFEPDFLLIRGAGTPLEEQVLACYAGPYGVIIGGRYRTSTLTRADLVLTETPVQERFLGRRLGRRRLQRLPKYVDPAFGEGGRPAEERDIDVLAVGKFEPHKNHVALVPLFARALRIVIVGDGSLRRSIAARASGMPAVVELPGEVPAEVVAALLRRTKVLAHPSLSEGFPRAIAEAMVAGVPSVSLDGVIGHPVVHGVNGLTVPRGAYAEEILALLSDEERRLALSKAGREVGLTEFSHEALQRASRSISGRIRRVVEAGDPTYERNRRIGLVRRRVWDLGTAGAARMPGLANAVRQLGTRSRRITRVRHDR